jgi:ABC-2 type transport system permease protein
MRSVKTILRIARIELALQVYSPIAWFLLVAFLIQAVLVYTNSIGQYLMFQEQGGFGERFLQFLTNKLFSPPNGRIWEQLASNLYLYLPLLTMGLMARETNAGTIKLLYSSPIKVREIIFGKFVAMMVYNLVFVSILAIIVVLAVFNIHQADLGMLLSGLLGFYLLLCAYAAIGLFMSCLTTYQVVAALSTLAVLGVFSYIGTIWQGIDFVRDLTYFLSINGRATNFFVGLISSKDVIYFAVIVGMFLAFSIYKLQSDRESKPVWLKISRYVLIVTLALAAGYISSRPRFALYVDATATKTMTLTKNAQHVVKEMADTPLVVTSYVNLLDQRMWYGAPEQRNRDMDRWEPFLRFKPNISFNYVYYYDSVPDPNLYKYNQGKNLAQLAEKYAKSYHLDLGLFKKPDEIRRIIDLRPEEDRYVMQLSYKGQKTFLRLFNDNMVFPSETETSAALKRLMLARMPKIAFCQGEAERGVEKRGDRHYRLLANEITFRYSLVNQGFDPETINLRTQDIPEDISALVIADPRLAFDSASLHKIYKYIADGGNLLIAGEPGKQDILNPLLQPLGLHLMDGMMLEKNKDFSPEMLQPRPTSYAYGITPALAETAQDSLPLMMYGAAALAYERGGPFTMIPLATSAPERSWNKRIRPTEDMIAMSDNEETGQNFGGAMAVTIDRSGRLVTEAKDPDPVTPRLAYDPAQGDSAGPLPVALGLTRTINGREQRIVVTGDADFLSNAELARQSPRNCNFAFSTALFSWFVHGEFPIDTSRPPAKDKRFDLTDAGLQRLKLVMLWILPGLLIVLGSVVLIRRRKK